MHQSITNFSKQLLIRKKGRHIQLSKPPPNERLFSFSYLNLLEENKHCISSTIQKVTRRQLEFPILKRRFRAQNTIDRSNTRAGETYLKVEGTKYQNLVRA